MCLMLLIHPLSLSAHEPNLFGQGLVVQQSNSLSPSTSLTMLLPPSQHSTAMIPSAPRTHAVSCITFAVTMLLSFTDWCFIHRAQLNCMPTNYVKSRWSDTDPTCRHCSEVETLPHPLCHCPPNIVAITTCHNKLVHRLTSAVCSGTITTDQTVRDSGSQVRPSIVIDDADSYSH